MNVELLDWRRRIATLYSQVRSTRDPAQAHELWRVTRDELLRTHPQSPIPPDLRRDFRGASVAAYEPSLRFESDVDTEVEPARLAIPTGTDGVVQLDRMGRVHLAGVGDLDVWWVAGYGGGVFIPLRDATSGATTYGGGRYLIDTAKGADLGGEGQTLVIDLNFAYNPSCAYDPAWACPLAPEGNVVSVPLPVGELYPGG